MEIARIVARCLWEESRLLQTAATAAQVRPREETKCTMKMCFLRVCEDALALRGSLGCALTSKGGNVCGGFFLLDNENNISPLHM